MEHAYVVLGCAECRQPVPAYENAAAKEGKRLRLSCEATSVPSLNGLLVFFKISSNVGLLGARNIHLGGTSPNDRNV
jgi:hypothetical protein